MIKQYVSEDKNNIRQKFKIFKRILDSNDEHEVNSRSNIRFIFRVHGEIVERTVPEGVYVRQYRI